MKFRFDIKVNDQDYLDFHKFWLTRSPYGKGQMRSARLAVAFIFIISMLVLLLVGDFSSSSSSSSSSAFLDVIPLLISLILMQVFFVRFLCLSLKRQIKSLKKKRQNGIFARVCCGIL